MDKALWASHGMQGGSGHRVPLAWGVWGPEEADLCPGRMHGSWRVRGQPGAPHLYKEDSGAACQHHCWETERRRHGAQHTGILRPRQHLYLCALLPGAPEAPEPLGARPSGAAAPAPAQGSVWPLQLHLLFLVPHAGFRLLHLIQDRPVSRTPSTSILF